MMNFGQSVKQLRLAQDKTLRQFCLEHGHDPSNWSKIERGVLAPPKDAKTMERWARQLGLTPGTEPWQEFLDQADVARGQIPADVLSDEKLAEKLPVFFRTIRGAALGGKDLEGLIEKVRRAHTGNERKG